MTKTKSLKTIDADAAAQKIARSATAYLFAEYLGAVRLSALDGKGQVVRQYNHERVYEYLVGLVRKEL